MFSFNNVAFSEYLAVITAPLLEFPRITFNRTFPGVQLIVSFNAHPTQIFFVEIALVLISCNYVAMWLFPL